MIYILKSLEFFDYYDYDDYKDIGIFTELNLMEKYCYNYFLNNIEFKVVNPSNRFNFKLKDSWIRENFGSCFEVVTFSSLNSTDPKPFNLELDFEIIKTLIYKFKIINEKEWNALKISLLDSINNNNVYPKDKFDIYKFDDWRNVDLKTWYSFFSPPELSVIYNYNFIKCLFYQLVYSNKLEFDYQNIILELYTNRLPIKYLENIYESIEYCKELFDTTKILEEYKYKIDKKLLV